MINHNTISLKEKIFKSLLVTLVLALGYFYTGDISYDIKQEVNIYFALDRMIPFIPFASWYYIFGLYFVFPYIVFKIKHKHIFHKSLIACMIVGAIAFLFFIFFPYIFPRPEISATGDIICHDSKYYNFTWDYLSKWCMRSIYSLDAPTNTFPSLHVAYVSVFSFAAFEEGLPNKYLYALNILLVYISTLLTKQHFILDGIAGFIIALLVYLSLKSVKT